jgi:hypothetical protein
LFLVLPPRPVLRATDELAKMMFQMRERVMKNVGCVGAWTAGVKVKRTALSADGGLAISEISDQESKLAD